MNRRRTSLPRRVANSFGVMVALAVAVVLIWLGGSAVLWLIGKIATGFP